ncbi:hypothetical protein APR50_06525 [Variovorax paradoxus]|nr:MULTISPECIES: RT0821/Lpp0805 family surface protein [unclassified Variovorax]KPU95210.1 hypothetical protein APR52_18985 [Variovorax paradoxus]KPV10442.1 hypothetical protein APR50_06525 [Variovorax paradoxus]KPV12918.1 hypothetical protein APR49_05870 [Variovorax paradoxus]KPV24145.1 hypothetical protein APR51_05340 [Variovorax paradoxus]KPV35260.1 hypothetical protein APR48_05085 [Variovorax paradoxus]
MKKVAPVLCVSCTALVLAGCSGLFSREPAGGTLTGSFGAVPGSVAARAMGDDDRRRVANALDALANGESSAWRNRETGDSFVFTPTRSFERGSIRCRDFRLEVVAGGRPDSIGGSACRQADGNWRLPA